MSEEQFSKAEYLFDLVFNEPSKDKTHNENYMELLNSSLSDATYFKNTSKLIITLLLTKGFLMEADPDKLEHLFKLSRKCQNEERTFILELTRLMIQDRALSRILNMEQNSSIPGMARSLKPTPKMIEAKKIIEESIRRELEEMEEG